MMVFDNTTFPSLPEITYERSISINLYQFKIGFFPTDPPSTAIATRNFWRDD